MKKNASPAAIAASLVGLIVLLVILYRVFFPPSPPSDMDNPNGMPAYASNFLKNRKSARPASGAPQPNGGIRPSAGSTTPGQ